MSERTLYERVEELRGYKYIRLKSGRLITFWDSIRALETAHTDLARAISRAFKLAGDDYYLESLEWKIDRIEEHIGAVRKHLEDLRGVKTVQERIALLRNTTGRTPEEAAAFLRKADEIERRLAER